jgi:elongation factor 1-alpha
MANILDSSIKTLPLPPENETGSIEYKLFLCIENDDGYVPLSDDKLEHTTTQMQRRLIQGSGECTYYIGVADNGNVTGVSLDCLELSLNALRTVTKKLNVNIVKSVTLLARKDHWYARVFIREGTSKYIDVKIAISGSVDSGKSTLLGVLHSGQFDDGNNSARNLVATHKHEIELGKTSYMSQHIVGFEADGKYVNDQYERKMLSWKDIVRKSAKIITFFDLAGHQKYLKTTLSGFSKVRPDYSSVLIESNVSDINNGMVDPNTGKPNPKKRFNRMTKEHIRICCTLGIPFYIILTKVDTSVNNPEIISNNMEAVNDLIRTGIRKKPFVVKSINDVFLAAEKLPYGKIVPVLKISSISGEGFGILKAFLNLLPQRNDYSKWSSLPLHMSVSEIFKVTTGHIVVSGLVCKGSPNVGDNVYVGPDGNGQYIALQIRSIEWKRVRMTSTPTGSQCCLGFKNKRKGITKETFRRGMQVISTKVTPVSVESFTVKLYVYKANESTMHAGYQTVLYINNIRQSAAIKEIRNSEGSVISVARAKDIVWVDWEFLIRPEFVEIGDMVIFMEHVCMGSGKIKKILTTKEVKLI